MRTTADHPTWKEILRADPCAYCFGAGGTVDHILPRPVLSGDERGHWTNLTAACVECNHQKDRGKDGGHRSVLFQLLAVRENKEREFRKDWREHLYIGRPVAGPFFKEGIVSSHEPLKVYLPLQDREWQCKNVLCLTPIYHKK